MGYGLGGGDGLGDGGGRPGGAGGSGGGGGPGGDGGLKQPFSWPQLTLLEGNDGHSRNSRPSEYEPRGRADTTRAGIKDGNM